MIVRNDLYGARSALRRGLVYYRHGHLRSNDVLLGAYPKSGGTWLRFLLAHLLTGQATDFDEVERLLPPIEALGTAREALARDGGRFIKSHDLPVLLRRPRAAVYLVRDCRDVAISYFHHLQRQGAASNGLDQHIDEFLDGAVGHYGSWQTHVARWISLVPAPRTTIRIFRYEDLLADPQTQLTRLCSDVGIDVPATLIEQAIDANSAETMRSKEGESSLLRSSQIRPGLHFVREAKAGQWQNVLTVDQRERFLARAGTQLSALGYST